MAGTDTSKNGDASDNPETLEECIEMAGTSGWYNILIYFMCAWGAFVPPMHTLSYQFLGATSDYWCSVPELTMANWTTEQIIEISVPSKLKNTSPIESCKMNDLNYTELAALPYETSKIWASQSVRTDPIFCDARSFNESSPNSVSIMWDLVCERRYLYSSTQAAVQAGMLFGSLLMGSLADIFGRRFVYMWSVPAYLVIGILTAYSVNVYMYIALKVLIALVAMSFYLCGMVLSLELCSTSQRSIIGSLFAMPWAIGYMVLPGIAYLVRDFEMLQIATTLSVLTLFPVFCIIPESPRWLIMKGRLEEALDVLKKIASKNKKTLPSDDKLMIILQRLHRENGTTQESKFTFKKVYELWTFKGWGLRLAFIFFSWFAVSLVYYGISLNPPNLSQDKYLFIFLGGVMEVPSYIVLYPIAKYIGRKKGLVSLFLLCAICIFGTLLVDFYTEQGSSAGYGWNMFLFLAGKLGITALFQLIWMYTTEIIPTDFRSVVVGEGSICARIGSICSPYIIDLLGAKFKWAPALIFGVVSVIAAFSMLFLPETKDVDLLESARPTKKNSGVELTHM